MSRIVGRRFVPALLLVLVAFVAGPAARQGSQRPLFRGGVDLVNVSATVTDADGHFVKGLAKDDFLLLEDGVELPIAQFSSERVPVSLGIVVDASSSMDGERMSQARRALEQLLDRLPDPDDEVFLYSFSEDPVLEHGWTTDRRAIRSALKRIDPGGRTSLYDAVGRAVSLANTGRHAKKALVIISDGNDTASHTSVEALQRQIQESELLVYAIGVDARSLFQPKSRRSWFSQARPGFPRPPVIQGFPPRPGGGGGRPPVLPRPPDRAPAPPPVFDDPVDLAALRSLTDDSGGRTEIVRTAGDLGPATSGIADELNRQYFLAYASNAPRDGKWHTIELSVRDREWTVRARRGFIAQ
ncbi:MAG TPA: VWA domain-containing protein [Vicinamibacterales bacterium]|nr:VWA domain-containing protein [Vicinamibacterales bacterium]